MILVGLIALPLAGGLAAWVLGSRPIAARMVTLAALLVDLFLALALAVSRGPWILAADGRGFSAQASWDWLPRFGIRFHLGVDALSLLLILLTLVLGVLAVLASWREIDERVGFFHLSLAWVLAGVIGLFLALDLFLFAFFWELMLVPMYFLIGIWGHERRVHAAIKFFLFTQASGLLMLLAIVTLALVRARTTGVWSFDYFDLLGTSLEPRTAMLLMLGFFVAFAVKLPAVPLHTWLPDAHTQAPTAGSLILAGLLLKTGAYGILRFAIPLFPEASRSFAPVGAALGVAGIVYGALLAFGQNDFKRLVAYTSVSHLGFVLLGAYAATPLAIQGVVLEMISHGLSTGGLFVLAGALSERTHTRDLRELGGLWAVTPRLGAATLVLAMASLGLPGLGNFVAELFILLGSFSPYPAATVIATFGLVLATVYSLAILQRAFFGPRPAHGTAALHMADLNGRETFTLGIIIALLVWLGLYPQPVLETLVPAHGDATDLDVAAVGAPHGRTP